MNRILGVDTGLSGALTLYEPGMPLSVHDMPTLRLSRGGKNKNEIDLYALARIIDDWSKNGSISAAYVERVSGTPQMGISSCFSFGRSAGIVLGALAAHSIPIEEIPPITWQRGMGIPRGAGKDAARALISRMFPTDAHLFARAKDDGRADAALLAIYGARQHAKQAA